MVLVEDLENHETLRSHGQPTHLSNKSIESYLFSAIKEKRMILLNSLLNKVVLIHCSCFLVPNGLAQSLFSASVAYKRLEVILRHLNRPTSSERPSLFVVLIFSSMLTNLGKAKLRNRQRNCQNANKISLVSNGNSVMTPNDSRKVQD